MTEPLDRFAAEAHSPFGETPVRWLALSEPGVERTARALGQAQAIIVGVDAPGDLPAVDPAAFDLLLTTRPDPPRPWAGVSDPAKARAVVEAAVGGSPFAAAMLRRLLRVEETLGFRDALELESLAYSALLGGEAFRRWRASCPLQDMPATPAEPVTYAREGDRVTLTLASPATRNATSAVMRDALCEALWAVLDDPSAPAVTLRASGRCFSVGGALDEFGRADDLARAHMIRTLRSPAALLDALGTRARVIQHGVSVGAGVEIAAAAAHRIARRGASFRLPELAMGLIPGAGGTVSVPRAIGRHRALWLILTGKRIGAPLALRWGLIHEIVA